jgi:hypothetical protein
LPPSITVSSSLLTHFPIRLVRIHLGQPEDEVELTLVTYNLENAPTHEALSYVWGSPPANGRVVLNGHNIGVLPTLLNAFRQLRKSDTEHLI